MRSFALLIEDLAGTDDKLRVENLVTEYLSNSTDEDRIAAVKLLSGIRPKRLLPLTQLYSLAIKNSTLQKWLWEVTIDEGADLCEAISFCLPIGENPSDLSLAEFISALDDQRFNSQIEQTDFVEDIWNRLSTKSRWIANRLITGTFRKTIYPISILKALKRITQLPLQILALRVILPEFKSAKSFDEFFLSEHNLDTICMPYAYKEPTCLAPPFEVSSSNQIIKIELFDGLNCQLIKRKNQVFIWKKDEQLLNSQLTFLEKKLKSISKDFVILARLCSKDSNEDVWSTQHLEPLLKNQKKISTKNKEFLFLCHDILELEGVALKETARARLKILDSFLKVHHSECGGLLTSATYTLEPDHEELLSFEYPVSQILMRSQMEDADLLFSGFPNKLFAVLLYVHRNEGLSSNSYVNYTFAVKGRNESLVPIVKLFDGLSQIEHETIASFVRENTVERFGPTRSVNPKIIVEIQYQRIEFTKRRKSGITLVDPVLVRLVPTLHLDDVSDLKQIKELYINMYNG